LISLNAKLLKAPFWGFFDSLSIYLYLATGFNIGQINRFFLTFVMIFQILNPICALPEARYNFKLIFVLKSYCNSDSVVLATS